jgi:hypothetical protein
LTTSARTRPSSTISLTFSTRTNLSLHKCHIPSRSLSTKVSVHEGNCLADKYVTVLGTTHIYDKNKLPDLSKNKEKKKE